VNEEVAFTVLLYVPDEQPLHAVLPALDHVPATHPAHACTDVAFSVLLYVPATQLVHEAAPALDHVPAGQPTHPSSWDTRPVPVPCVPAGHAVHVTLFVPAFHVPLAHREHPPPFGYSPAEQLTANATDNDATRMAKTKRMVSSYNRFIISRDQHDSYIDLCYFKSRHDNDLAVTEL